MGYDWPEESYRKLPLWVQRVREVLEDWFWAMERGEVDGRLPDPGFPVEITGEMADLVVREIDEGYERELRTWAHKPEAGGYQLGPGFGRLKGEQRVALAQALWAAIREGEEKEGEGNGE